MNVDPLDRNYKNEATLQFTDYAKRSSPVGRVFQKVQNIAHGLTVSKDRVADIAGVISKGVHKGTIKERHLSVMAKTFPQLAQITIKEGEKEPKTGTGRETEIPNQEEPKTSISNQEEPKTRPLTGRAAEIFNQAEEMFNNSAQGSLKKPRRNATKE